MGIFGAKRVAIKPRGYVALGDNFVDGERVGFTTAAFPSTRPTPGAWPGRDWPDHIGRPPSWFAAEASPNAFNTLLASPDCIRIREGGGPSAATVQTGGWVTGWVCSLIQLIAVSIQACRMLCLVAVKGGPACWFLHITRPHIGRVFWMVVFDG